MGAERRCLFILSSAISISLVFVLHSLFAFSSPKAFPTTIIYGMSHPPAFAYYISGGRGDGDQIFRLLLAVYHPRNRYLLHLGAEASDEERMRLVSDVNAVPAIKAFGNVDVMGRPNRLTDMGSSHIASTLRAASILLRFDAGWSWFVQLSASDYPLVTQDDLFHVFSSLSRELNFIDHTSDLGWKESQRFQPVVVDPGLYLARRSPIFYSTQKRPTPDAFKLFTGSPWAVLSRSFLEFCILGWDNLPRTLLMYFNNVVLAEEGYFHSVICNIPEFKNTTVNSDLRYMVWDNPPKMEPLFLNVSDYNQMIDSGAVFARQFHKDDHILDLVDEKILKRGRNCVVPGAWCSGQRSWWTDPCSKWGDVNIIEPGSQVKKLEKSLSSLLDQWNSEMNQCK